MNYIAHSDSRHIKKTSAAEHECSVAIRLNVHKMDKMLVFIMQTLLVANKLRLDSQLYVVMNNRQLLEIYRVSMKRSVKVKPIRSVREGAHYWVPGIWDRYKCNILVITALIDFKVNLMGSLN